MDDAVKKSLYSALRSVLIATGAYATGKGWISNEVANQVIGALLVAAPAIWGMVEKIEADTRRKEALAALQQPTLAEMAPRVPTEGEKK